MSRLVDYGSSDEEGADMRPGSKGFETSNIPNDPNDKSPQVSQLGVAIESHDPYPGNALPSGNDDLNEIALGPRALPEDPSPNGDTNSAPQSPYSANRAAIRNFTLPTTPNFDIPPSPLGSPPPGIDKKFEHFLELKRQGIHFNEKLAKSSALKNPGLLARLMDSAGVDEEDQYNTTLPEEDWNPKGFPTWTYKDELAKEQQQIAKKRQEEKSKLQRERIDFVSATASAESTRNGVPATTVGFRGSRASAAERVMAGLDQDRMRLPQVNPGSNRKEPERRTSRFDDNRSGIGPRSPKRRKRSASRSEK